MPVKCIDYDVLQDRVLAVLEENDEKDIKGIAAVLISWFEYVPLIDIDIVFDFCECYGCSVDYLLGRTDNYWL